MIIFAAVILTIVFILWASAIHEDMKEISYQIRDVSLELARLNASLNANFALMRKQRGEQT